MTREPGGCRQAIIVSGAAPTMSGIPTTQPSGWTSPCMDTTASSASRRDVSRRCTSGSSESSDNGWASNSLVAEAAAVRWVLLADARRARLLRCGMTEWGRCRVGERCSIDATQPRREHGRSAHLWKNATITFGIEDNEGEDLRRFAGEIVAWLQHGMEEFGIQRLHILASGRFLGALRKVRQARLARHHPLERKADLRHLSAGKLAKPSEIRHLMASARRGDSVSRGGQ